MLLRITHRTEYRYDNPAYDSHNEMRIRPWDSGDQSCLAFDLRCEPAGAILEYRDFFGNHAHSVSVPQPHDSLTIVAQSLVEKTPPPDNHYPEVSFERFLIDDEVREQTSYEFLNASRYVPFSNRLRKFFWMTSRPRPGEDVANYVMRIVQYLRDQFEYETSTTHVHSNLDDILKTGGGVCQDFAHLTLGILRLAGVPARYVSGYLTPPPDNFVAELGEQASHAWIEAWLPGTGWTGFDPTHRCRTDERFIGVAVGRDYNDVPPIRGVFRSEGGRSIMSVDLKFEPRTVASPNGFEDQSQQ